MASKHELVFNQTVYQANEVNRWKFLEEIQPAEAPGFLLSSPVPIISLTSAYILFVCFIGPYLMRNREPFQLKNVIRFYNLVMVLLALVLFQRVLKGLGSFGSLFDCSKTFDLTDESSSIVYRMGNFIVMVRLSEYLDTIFFTLRKKQNQVTFLHVFHHAFVPMYAYWILRTAPVRFNVYIILINSFIHILMYFYYFLATFQQPRDSKQKPSFTMLVINKLLMFKRYMTQLQILQFVSLGGYAIFAALQPNNCNIPWTYITANFLLAFGFLSLFVHFYLQVYRSQARAAKAAAAAAASVGSKTKSS